MSKTAQSMNEPGYNALKDLQRNTIKAWNNAADDTQRESQLNAALEAMAERESRRFRDGVRFGLRFALKEPSLVADELATMNEVDGL